VTDTQTHTYTDTQVNLYSVHALHSIGQTKIIDTTSDSPLSLHFPASLQQMQNKSESILFSEKINKNMQNKRTVIVKKAEATVNMIRRTTSAV